MRVVIADDSMLVREGIASLLQSAGIDVVAQCSDPEELLRDVDVHKPDLAIVDIRMPPTHTDEGLRAAHELRARHPGMGDHDPLPARRGGRRDARPRREPEGLGYLVKDRVSDLEEFLDTLRRVAGGGTALDPLVVSALLAATRDDGPLTTLTAREREVLELVAEGLSNQAIAERMTITLRSAEKYVSSIFTKLGLPATGSEHRRVLAVLRFLRA